MVLRRRKTGLIRTVHKQSSSGQFGQRFKYEFLDSGDSTVLVSLQQIFSTHSRLQALYLVLIQLLCSLIIYIYGITDMRHGLAQYIKMLLYYSQS